MLEKDLLQRVPSVRQVGLELEAILKGRENTPSPFVKSTTGVTLKVSLPLFMQNGENIERPVFVTREAELAQLQRFLERSLAGHGQVAFISGDPGQGKTALAQEFARRAQTSHPDLVVASGNCNAYTGIGDPYLPFREIIGLLTGDIESRWEAGAIDQEQAARLWQASPLTFQALVESGRDLVDIFVPGDILLRRAMSFSSRPAKWLPSLKELVVRKASLPSDPGFQQAALFEQYTRLLRALSRHKPLLLVLDDLQWADSGSINLLFHLGKGVEGCRIMILGTYRSTEVALGRGGERHPLEPIVNEFKRQFGNLQIELGKSDGRRFVDAFVDSEPNRLDENFRATLFRLSEGQPLGTIELLRDMQERGGLVQDADGYWIEGPDLNWETLPARLEGMIAERIDRLEDAERQILKAASVEGETFTAEIVAQALSVDADETVRLLSNELDKRHHLVNAQNIREVNGQRLSTYRFRHILFQRYLYNSLDTVERPRLHQAIGTTLQNLYGEGKEEIAGQLALHFREAGKIIKAADYLNQAGDRARELVAHQEAIDHYQEAITSYEQALGDKWDPLQRAMLERKIGEAFFRRGQNQQALEHLGKALSYLGKRLPDSRWGVRLDIIRNIINQIGHRFAPRLFLKPASMITTPMVEEECRLYEYAVWVETFMNDERMLMVTLRLLNVAERTGFAYAISLGSSGLGMAFDYIAIFRPAGYYHQRAVAFAKISQSPSVLGATHLTLSFHEAYICEYPSAIQRGRKAMDIYNEINDSHSWGMASLQVGARSIYYKGDFAGALARGVDMVKTGREKGDLVVQCWGLWIQGNAQRHLGQLDQAVLTLKEAVELAQRSQVHLFYKLGLEELGQSYLRQGSLELALNSQDTLLSYHAEYPKTTASFPLYNCVAEAYLQAVEQCTEAEQKEWFKQADWACRKLLKHGQKFNAQMPDAMRLRGTYEWLKGKPAAAQTWWQRSLAFAEKIGQRYDIGMAHLEIGRRVSNRDHLESAAAIFAEIGAQWDLEQTQKAIGKL
jgi:tetratricopeptide (TPR) repeat protein